MAQTLISSTLSGKAVYSDSASIVYVAAAVRNRGLGKSVVKTMQIVPALNCFTTFYASQRHNVGLLRHMVVDVPFSFLQLSSLKARTASMVQQAFDLVRTVEWIGAVQVIAKELLRAGYVLSFHQIDNVGMFEQRCILAPLPV